MYIFTFQVVKDTTNFTLFEGQAGVQFKVIITAPPHILGRSILFDNPHTWKVILKIKSGVDESALKCPDDVILHQVVTTWHMKGQPTSQLACHAEINETNWHLPYTVTLKAVSDNKIDGNKSGYFSISSSFQSNTTTRDFEDIAQEKVNIFLFVISTHIYLKYNKHETKTFNTKLSQKFFYISSF